MLVDGEIRVNDRELPDIDLQTLRLADPLIIAADIVGVAVDWHGGIDVAILVERLHENLHAGIAGDDLEYGEAGRPASCQIGEGRGLTTDHRVEHAYGVRVGGAVEGHGVDDIRGRVFRSEAADVEKLVG